MNALLIPNEVEDRFRRTLAARSEHMVPGDGRLGGARWPRPPAPALARRSGRSGPFHSRGRRGLCAAAAALIIGVGGAAAIGLKRGDDRDRVASRESTTAGTATTPRPPRRMMCRLGPSPMSLIPSGSPRTTGYRIPAQF